MPLSSVVGAQSIVKPGVCTSSTRPASPFEGQMIYETDTDKVLVYNGTAWKQVPTAATAGTVLQIVSATTTTPTANSTSTYADTTLTVTITPSSSSSKILILVNQNGGWKSSANAGSAINCKLVRTATDISVFGIEVGYNGLAQELISGSISAIIFDSPSTTSAVTYKTQFANRVNAAQVTVQLNGAMSTITACEISA